jgi:trans-aconitate 2-methyltransferase
VTGVPRDWNAAVYHEVSSPHQVWGREVLDRLALRGDETVADLGCGTGRITAALLERLPRGRVVAVDGSASMVARARETLGERATVIHSDLLDLALPRPVDTAISTATFHWIADHDRLFARVHDALRPGGRFVAQCGGEGNIASLVEIIRRASAEEPFAASFAGWDGPWNYAGAEQTAERLRRAGFAVERVWLQPSPVVVEDLRTFLETVNLGAHLDRLPADLRTPFADRVHAEARHLPALDYVRLNLIAHRPA